MLDYEDLKWIATSTTELNSMLQQISRYSDLARQHKGQHNYIDLLGERVETAAKTAQELFDRVTSTILQASDPKRKMVRKEAMPAPFSVVPAPEGRIWPPSKILEQLAPKPTPTLRVAEAAPPSPQNTILNPAGKRELILLVDDEVEISQLASMMLTDEGYRVILAKDGFEALKIYQKMGQDIALVILDFFLPIMDGDAVFDELRALNPEIGVVLSSGFAEQSKVAAMLDQGLRGFIPKPYTSEKLIAQIRSALDAPRTIAR